MLAINQKLAYEGVHHTGTKITLSITNINFGIFFFVHRYWHFIPGF